MKVCWNPDPGIRTKGQLKPVAIALASIVFPGPGRAEEEQASLALAAGFLEGLAGLRQGDDPADLLLGLLLAANVLQANAPVRVARLEAAHLGDADQHHRAQEDQRVEEEEEREREEQSDQLLTRDEVVDRVVDRGRAVDPARGSAGHEQTDDPDQGQDYEKKTIRRKNDLQKETRRRLMTSSSLSASSSVP